MLLTRNMFSILVTVTLTLVPQFIGYTSSLNTIGLNKLIDFYRQKLFSTFDNSDLDLGPYIPYVKATPAFVFKQAFNTPVCSS